MLHPPLAPSILKRWILFCSVGAIGILVQMTVLMLLISGFKMNYLVATGLAVEAAVLNNFFWHENWTWADRAKGSIGSFWRRICYFHLSNGACVEQIDWMADPSPTGRGRSFGIMANYLYEPDRIPERAEAYTGSGHVSASAAVRDLTATR